METEDQDTERSIWSKPAPFTLLGVLFLGLVGSLLYDLVVKPGLSSVGRLSLSLITLGSRSLRDAAYSSAALDPTPTSALILLYGGLVALLLLPADVLIRRRKKTDGALRGLVSPLGASKQALLDEIAKGARRIRRLKIIFLAVFVPYWLALMIALMVHDQSVLIWRVFHTNLAILTPKLSDEERGQFLADFAAMKNRDDYTSLKIKMSSVATERKVVLKDIETW